MKSNFTFTYNAPAMPTAQPALEAFDLFPTRIWQARTPALAAQFPAWIDAALAMRAASPKPAGRTNRHGWNSEDMAVLERARVRSVAAGDPRRVRELRCAR